MISTQCKLKYVTIFRILQYESPSQKAFFHPPSNPVRWQTSERSPLLVIELTSFPKYQEPCWIIKNVPILGYIFQAEAKHPYVQKTEPYLLNCRAKRRWEVYFFHSSTFSLVRTFCCFSFPLLLCYNCSGRVALCGDWIAVTLVISTRKPVITQTTPLPSATPWALCRPGVL